ncbi:MAG: MFS transporter [Spirochaetaceae bacterium]|nr:MAG: MFS transporter [Spirochaetaceae bacterium]
MSRLKFAGADYAGALGFFVYASSVVVTPIVLLRLGEDLAFGLAEGGGIEAVRAFFLLAILIASGAAAARWGKIPTLAVGGLVLAVGLFAYAAAPSYAIVLAAVVLVGLGGGILEALINPLIQDAHPHDSGRYLNVVNAFFSVGVLVSVVVVGDLLTRGVSWRVLVAGVGVLAVGTAALFGLASRRDRPNRPAAAAEKPGAGFLGSAARIVREPLFWIYSVAMFCGGGAEGAFTFWSASYIQIHFDAVARAGAIGTAAFAAGMVVGRIGFGRMVRQGGLQTLIIASALAGVVLSIIAYRVDGMGALYAVLFAAGVSIACFWPSIQSHAATRVPHDSTTLFVLLSCAGIPGFGLTSWAMGLIAERAGLRASLLVIPALLTVLAVAMVAGSRIGSRPEDR